MEGPLLEDGAASVVGERDDPEVPVGAFWRRAVDDFQAGDGGVALGGNDLKSQGEDLVGSLTLVVPELCDCVQAAERIVKGRRLVGRVGGEQVEQGLGALSTPRRLIGGDPGAEPVCHRG
jgi:hypothetical protein